MESIQKEVAAEIQTKKEKDELKEASPVAPQHRTIVITVPYDVPASIDIQGQFSRYELVGLFGEILESVRRGNR